MDTKDIDPIDNIDFDIRPTVSTGEIQLRFNNNPSLGSKVLIHDMNGQLVYEISEAQEISYDIDLSDLASGLYVASLYMESGVLSRRFVIAR